MSIEQLLNKYKEFKHVGHEIKESGGFEVCKDFTVAKISTVDGEASIGGLRRGERLPLSRSTGDRECFEFRYGDWIIMLPELALQILASSGKIKPIGPPSREEVLGNWLELAANYLKANGYDGLCSVDEECGCSIDDLAPCGCFYECLPAYDHGNGKAGYRIMRRSRPSPGEGWDKGWC